MNKNWQHGKTEFLLSEIFVIVRALILGTRDFSSVRLVSDLGHKAS